MQNVQLGGAAIVLLALAGTMVAYERRQNAKRPLFGGRETITLYRVAYLTFFVLGLICGLAAIIR